MKRVIRHDLFPALVTIGLIAGVYALTARERVPSPGGPWGLLLGILGFLLMLWAEVGYSLRKRLRRFTRGSMQFWLRVHIFSGLTGAALALLHAGGRIQGLAGILALFTLLIVFSGFVGRFLFTAIPRTLEGAELTLPSLLAECAQAERRLIMYGLPPDDPILQAQTPSPIWLICLGRRPFQMYRARQIHSFVRHLPDAGHAAEIQRLLEARYAWMLEIRTLAAARRLISLWHTMHVPLGLVLFTLAAVHISAALYYSLLQR